MGSIQMGLSEGKQVPREVDEAHLLDLSIKGDAAAYAVLYDGYLAGIYRYFYCHLEDDSQAEALTESAFVRAWEKLDRFQLGQEPFQLWLLREARGLIFEHERHTGRRDDKESGARLQQGDPLNASARDVVHALQGLEPLQRDVIILRYICELRAEEVAHVAGVDAGRVYEELHRGLVRLGDAMAEE
jgi:RNA polymerase sigma-70 factor (ECF subfamily)